MMNAEKQSFSAYCQSDEALSGRPDSNDDWSYESHSEFRNEIEMKTEASATSAATPSAPTRGTRSQFWRHSFFRARTLVFRACMRPFREDWSALHLREAYELP